MLLKLNEIHTGLNQCPPGECAAKVHKKSSVPKKSFSKRNGKRPPGMASVLFCLVFGRYHHDTAEPVVRVEMLTGLVIFCGCKII